MNGSGSRTVAARPRGRPWMPLLVAVGVAGAMVWLAGEPLRAARFAGAALREPPPGDRTSFPRRFSWTPVPGADSYEVTVVRGRTEILFRQRGASPVLDVSFDPAQEPPPGDYVWEVRALRGEEELGIAQGSFRVLP